jgi:hypothetical protein
MYTVKVFRSETNLGLRRQLCGLEPTIQQILADAEGNEARRSTTAVQTNTGSIIQSHLFYDMQYKFQNKVALLKRHAKSIVQHP